MSRSGYTDDGENVAMWRGAVRSALRGKRGQALLKEMLAALDALPEKRLVSGEIEVQETGMPFRLEPAAVCAIGSVTKARGINTIELDPEDDYTVVPFMERNLNIAEAMVREIMWINDEAGHYKETPEQRFERVREWVAYQIIKPGEKRPIDGWA